LIATMLFSVLTNTLLFVSPLYMLQVYDRVLASRNIGTLVALTVIAVFLLAMWWLIDMVRTWVLVRAGVKFDERLKSALFKTMLRASLASRSPTAAQSLRDMDTVREFATGQAFITMCDAPFAVIFVAVCFLFHFWLGVVAVVGALILLVLALINEWATRTTLANAARASMDASNFALNSTRNIEVIHALGMHKEIEDRWAEMHKNQLGWQALASDRAGVVLAASKVVRQLLQIAILGLGAWLAVERQISPGMMIAASIMMGRALAPVEQSVGQWKGFLAARSAWKRLKALFIAFPEMAERTELPVPAGKIAVEGLVVRSPDNKTAILKGLGFELGKGQLLAVVGPSGSGKSTLARSLVGVWQPTIGSVRIDGADLRHWDAQRLGQYIGYLPQDVELFSGTVAENIARLRRGEISNDVVAAAKLAGVHDFIQSLPEGYDTQIGEGGGVLSGGQRQRVGLARALFGSPAYIVLDEPNAHLDAAGENELAKALQRIKEAGITVVVITHKANLLAVADRVLILADGQARAFGPPAEVFKEMAGPRIISSNQAVGGAAAQAGPGAQAAATTSGAGAPAAGGGNGPQVHVAQGLAAPATAAATAGPLAIKKS
jgi:PrtD family type I secretion system ABC transporter